MCSDNKQEFNRDELVRICANYYIDKGYSVEIGYKIIERLSDKYLQYVFDEIYKERANKHD